MLASDVVPAASSLRDQRSLLKHMRLQTEHPQAASRCRLLSPATSQQLAPIVEPAQNPM